MTLHLVNHPLVHDASMVLRDERTAPPEIRRVTSRISFLLAADALCDVPSTSATVRTPQVRAVGVWSKQTS